MFWRRVGCRSGGGGRLVDGEGIVAGMAGVLGDGTDDGIDAIFFDLMM